MSAAYESMFPKQTGGKPILLDANDSPVHQLDESKTKVEKKKELSEERKERAKRWSENTQQQEDCPHLRCGRKNLGSKVGP